MASRIRWLRSVDNATVPHNHEFMISVQEPQESSPAPVAERGVSLEEGLSLPDQPSVNHWLPVLLWSSLAFAGHVSALQLVEVGPHVRYQHYKPLDWLLTETNPIWPALLIAQTVLVVLGLRTMAASAWTWTKARLGGWAVAAAAVVCVLTSAALSRDSGAYLGELCLSSLIQAISLGNVLLAVLAIPAQALAALGSGGTNDAVEGSRGFGRGKAAFVPWIGGLWVTVLASVLCWLSYERHPHVPDEAAYLYQAQYFTRGWLTAPVSAEPRAFDVDLILYEADHCYSCFPPGWPAILAVGVWLGVPWIINPLLAGVNVFAVHRLLIELYDRRTANLATLLLCASPWYLFLAMSFMAHICALSFVLIACLGIVWARRTGNWTWAALAGLTTGVVSLIRPLEGLALGGLVGLWALGLGGSRLRFASLAALALGTFTTGSLNLVYNYQVTGDARKFPVTAYFDKNYGPGCNAMGFGPDRGVGWTGFDPFPGHGPVDVAINANLNLAASNVELFGWSTGSFFLLAWLFFGCRWNRGDRLMWFAAFVVAGIHSFYWFSGGPDFGARYWFLLIVPSVALTARAAQELASRLEQTSPAFDGTSRVYGAIAVLCATSLAVFVPWRAIDKYHHYRGMRADIRRLAEDHDFRGALVLVQGLRYPDYASAAVYNSLDHDFPGPVYAWDRSADVRANVLRLYPDRAVWVVRGPTLTQRGFEIVQGPVLPSQRHALLEHTPSTTHP